MEDEPDYHIEIHRGDDPAEPSDEAIREALRLTLSSHSCRKASISVAIVDDAQIARLNESYLQHAGPTDVLSFDLGGEVFGGGGNGEIDGQIVVSAETARREAARRAVRVEGELLLYVIHGTLHLLGFDDASAEAAAVMHREEDALLTSLGCGAVYRRGAEEEGE